VAAGHSVGAMSAGLVASLGGASVLGVHLAERGYLGGGLSHLAVVAGLACTAAALSFLTQRYLVLPNTVTSAMPDAMVQAQHLMPALTTLGLLVAGGVVPVTLLAYWVCNAVWTLAQSAVVWQWFPTPGSIAAARHHAQH
jgi:YidC/Oxa1 family membrane protein insertase